MQLGTHTDQRDTEDDNSIIISSYNNMYIATEIQTMMGTQLLLHVVAARLGSQIAHAIILLLKISACHVHRDERGTIQWITRHTSKPFKISCFTHWFVSSQLHPCMSMLSVQCLTFCKLNSHMLCGLKVRSLPPQHSVLSVMCILKVCCRGSSLL